MGKAFITHLLSKTSKMKIKQRISWFL